MNSRILISYHINLSSQKIVQYKYSEMEINRVQPDIKEQQEQNREEDDGRPAVQLYVLSTVQYDNRILDASKLKLSSKKFVQYKYSEMEINRAQPDYICASTE